MPPAILYCTNCKATYTGEGRPSICLLCHHQLVPKDEPIHKRWAFFAHVMKLNPILALDDHRVLLDRSLAKETLLLGEKCCSS